MKNTKTTYIKLKPADWQSEKAVGIDGLIAEESTDQTKRIRFFIPKSLMRADTAPAWFLAHRAHEIKEEWAGNVQGGCFSIEGITVDDSPIFC